MLESAFAQTAEEVRGEAPHELCCRCSRGPAGLACCARQTPPILQPPSSLTRPQPPAQPPQVLAHYGTDPQQGLSAAQVAEARRLHGRNELAPEQGGCRRRRWNGG